MGALASLLRFLDHTQTHHSRQDSSGRVIGTSQRPLPDNTQHSQKTGILAPGGIRTCNPRKAAAADPRLRLRGYLDRRFITVLPLLLILLLLLFVKNTAYWNNWIPEYRVKYCSIGNTSERGKAKCRFTRNSPWLLLLKQISYPYKFLYLLFYLFRNWNCANSFSSNYLPRHCCDLKNTKNFIKRRRRCE